MALMGNTDVEAALTSGSMQFRDDGSSFSSLPDSVQDQEPFFQSAYSQSQTQLDHKQAQKEFLYKETVSLLPMIHKKLKAKAYTQGGQDFEMLFEFFDANHDGMLTNEELRVAVRRNLGIPPAVLSDRHIRLVFNALDEDKSGSLELGEFVDFLIRGPAALKITEEMVEAATKDIKLTTDQKMPWLKRRQKALTSLKRMYPRRLGREVHEKEPETDFGWVPEVSHRAEVKLSDGAWHACEVTAGPSLLDGTFTVNLPEVVSTGRTLVKRGRLVPEVLSGADLILTQKWKKTQKKDPLAALNKVDTFPCRKHAYVPLSQLRPQMLHRHSGKLGPEFDVGDEVEAEDRATRRWYPATVTAQPNLRRKQTATTVTEYDVAYAQPVFGNERHRVTLEAARTGLETRVRRRAGASERAEALCIGLRSSSEAQRCVAAAEARSLARERQNHAALREAKLHDALAYALELYHKQQQQGQGQGQGQSGGGGGSRPTTAISASVRIKTPGTPTRAIHTPERRVATPEFPAAASTASAAAATQQEQKQKQAAETLTLDAAPSPSLLETAAAAVGGGGLTQSAPSLLLPPIVKSPSPQKVDLDTAQRRRKELFINLSSALRMLKQKKVGKYFS